MKHKLTWTLKSFSELTTDELYKFLQQRQDVFILEQECKYPDLDDKDRTTLHLMGWIDNQLVAYARIFKPGDLFENKASFGRVLIHIDYRKLKLGRELIQQLIDVIEAEFQTSTICIEAQYYLLSFYEDFGFKAYGDTFFDAGVKHIMMLRK